LLQNKAGINGNKSNNQKCAMIETKQEINSENNNSFFADIISAISGKQKNKSHSQIDRRKQASLDQSGSLIVEKLNYFISSGVQIYVLENDLEVKGRKLSVEEEFYFRDNFDAVLCFLQQSLLQKKLFSERKDLFDDFDQSIYEMERILIEKGTDKDQAYFEAVKYQTRDWFLRLLLSSENAMWQKLALQNPVPKT
jgi:hypothetical protein